MPQSLRELLKKRSEAPAKRHEIMEKEWVKLPDVFSFTQAELLRSVLEEEGIESVEIGDLSQAHMGSGVFREIMVKKTNYYRAVEITEELGLSK